MIARMGLLMLVAGWAVAEPQGDTDVVTLDNGTMRMVVNVHGGAVSSCTLKGNDLNPFSWKAKRWPGNPSIKEGLFVCFDRLGKPSKTDLDRGIPFHGEATGVRWDVLEQEASAAGNLVVRMRCRLPVAKMVLEREYCLFKDSSVCRVTDRIRNENDFRKPYNMLQHPSLAAPFLDRSVLVDCNAERGYIDTKDIRKLPAPTVSWPEVEFESKPINLRLVKDRSKFVANYVCDEETVHGWGCVSNPGKGLLVGCLWPTADYPWIRVWRECRDEAPKALGVEFSTTPLGVPLEEIEQVGELLGHQTIEYLDPGAETVKTFYLFLSEIPPDFSGVGEIAVDADSLNIKERNPANKRQWALPCRP
jgi:hypothetical protein